MRVTRSILEVFSRTRHPVTVITKNHLVTRDIDFFRELARFQAVAVALSITTLDPHIARENRLLLSASVAEDRRNGVESLPTSLLRVTLA